MSETVQDMINDITAGNFTSANTTFNDMLQDKIVDSLEQEKIKLAGQVYDDQEEDEDEVEDLLSDEEVDELMDDELMDDDEEEDEPEAEDEEDT